MGRYGPFGSSWALRTPASSTARQTSSQAWTLLVMRPLYPGQPFPASWLLHGFPAAGFCGLFCCPPIGCHDPTEVGQLAVKIQYSKPFSPSRGLAGLAARGFLRAAFFLFNSERHSEPCTPDAASCS